MLIPESGGEIPCLLSSGTSLTDHATIVHLTPSSQWLNEPTSRRIKDYPRVSENKGKVDGAKAMDDFASPSAQAFSDHVASCRVCLDLNRDYLRRQWRWNRYGDEEKSSLSHAPFVVPFDELEQSIRRGQCRGCMLVHAARLELLKQFDFAFPRAELEYLDRDGLSGLVLTMNMYYPNDMAADEVKRARSTEHISVVNKASVDDVDAEHARFEIRTPTYEIFKPSMTICLNIFTPLINFHRQCRTGTFKTRIIQCFPGLQSKLNQTEQMIRAPKWRSNGP